MLQLESARDFRQLLTLKILTTLLGHTRGLTHIVENTNQNNMTFTQFKSLPPNLIGTDTVQINEEMFRQIQADGMRQAAHIIRLEVESCPNYGSEGHCEPCSAKVNSEIAILDAATKLEKGDK